MLRNKRKKRRIGGQEDGHPWRTPTLPFPNIYLTWSFLANLKANVSTKLVLPLENDTSPKE